jgi:hypothetical protein
MVLAELGLVEQRYKAVFEVFEGATVTEVATRYGVTARRCTAGSVAMQTAAWRPSRQELETRPVPAPDDRRG